MRTTVTVRDDIAKDLMGLTSARSWTEAVNHAIQDWVRLKKIARLRSLRGRLVIEGDWEALRAEEIAEARRSRGRRSR